MRTTVDPVAATLATVKMFPATLTVNADLSAVVVVTALLKVIVNNFPVVSIAKDDCLMYDELLVTPVEVVKLLRSLPFASWTALFPNAAL